MSHRFRAGQKVTLAQSKFGSDRQGTFEIVRLMPEEHGINQYRLKSILDGRERVATEDELSRLE
jgi:FAD synthase